MTKTLNDGKRAFGPGRSVALAVCAAATFFGLTALAQSQFRDTAVVGFDGGQGFRSDCGDRLLVGFNFRHGDALDGIEPVCAGFGAQGQRISAVEGNGRFFGGRGGDATSILCPSDMAVQGMMITVNPPFVRDMVLKCTNLATGAKVTEVGRFGGRNSMANEAGLRTYQGPDYDCRSNELAWGITGASSSMINRLGLICRSGVPGLRAGLSGGLGKIMGGVVSSEPVPPPPKSISLEDRYWCRGYADRAVAANVAVKGKPCGLSGPRHTAPLSDHMVWCLNSPREAVLTEERARDQEVRACQVNTMPRIKRVSRPTGNANADRCNAYADEAIAANQQAIDYQCGLGADGGRHQATREAHFAYCMNAPEAAVTAEAARRRQDVEACSTCRSYSRTAVAHIEESKSCSIPPQGDLWMPNEEDPHFHACFINRPGTAPFVNPGVSGFQAQREASLAQCKQ